jgi:hypothetical protein
MNRNDPFAGNWKLNPEKSHFDPNHRPSSGIMSWERTSEGYSMRAEGTTSEGKLVQERPQTFILDGKDHPVPGAPGLAAIMSRPDPNTIHMEAKKAGGVVGKGSYVVSGDGATLTATVSGTDAQQRPFQTVVIWDRA